MTFVFDARGLTPPQRLVALALADHADHEGRNAYPAVNTLAAKTELHRRTVQRALADLVASGFLEIVGLGGGRSLTNSYAFPGMAVENPGDIQGITRQKQWQPDTPTSAKPGQPRQERVAESAVKGGTPDTQTKTNQTESKNKAQKPNRPDTRPTPDQTYLATKIAQAWDIKTLTPAAMQRLNTAHGVAAVTSAMRQVHGFPPEVAIRSAFAYIDSICKAQEA